MSWWQRQDLSLLALGVISVHEIREGIELAPVGAKRKAIEIWLNDFVLRRFAGRILPVDTNAADMSARLVVAAKSSGHNAELADALIAATAKVHGLDMATLNRKHFAPFDLNLVKF